MAKVDDVRSKLEAILERLEDGANRGLGKVVLTGRVTGKA
jgi:hypothetical protein